MTILLINDNRNQQEMFQEIVRRIDSTHICLKSFSTESALDLLLDSDRVLPDLIFLDLAFKSSGGKQFLSTLKSSDVLKAIPVCIYAESMAQSDQDEMIRLGAFHYVMKEQDFTSLSTSIRVAIASANTAHLASAEKETL